MDNPQFVRDCAENGVDGDGGPRLGQEKQEEEEQQQQQVRSPQTSAGARRGHTSAPQQQPPPPPLTNLNQNMPATSKKEARSTEEERGAMVAPVPVTRSGASSPVSNYREALPQVLATSAKNLLLLAYGMTLGFPTIVIPALQRGDEPNLVLSTEEISWFGSINLICVPVGCLASGALTTHLGRKRAMMLVNGPLLAAWLLLHFADTPALLYAALALTGLTGGLLEAPVLTYVAEITTPLMRGVLSSTSSMCVILGIFTQFMMGNILNWRDVALFNLAAPTIAFLALFLVPESPYWLASKGRTVEARASLCWLRGWVHPNAVEAEFNELLETVRSPIDLQHEDTAANLLTSSSWWKRFCRSLRPYGRATFVKPFLLVSSAFFFGHFCGMTTLQTFAVSIFTELGAPIDAYLATLILGMVELAGTLLCVVLVHWSGKRPLTLTSTVGTSLCFAVVAAYAQLRDSSLGTSESASWVPLTFLISSAFLTHMGIRLLPWILIGEVFPSDVRGMASGACSSVGYVFGFLANKTHFSLVEGLSLAGTFWMYACVSAVATLVLFATLPETEGRTLLEIQNHFAGRRQPGWKRRKPRTLNPDTETHEYSNGKKEHAGINGDVLTKSDKTAFGVVSSVDLESRL